MSRIMGIDYGKKRIGLAVTDPLQIIATGLTTVDTASCVEFLKKYLTEEEVECFVIGEPMHTDGRPAAIEKDIGEFIKALNKHFPNIKIERQDERYTSQEAKRIIFQSGAKKKKRQDKSLVDKISAVLILQEFMESQKY